MKIQLFVIGIIICLISFSAVVPVSTQTLQLRFGWNLVTLTWPLESMQSNVDKFLSLKPMAYDGDRRCYVACNRADDLNAGYGYWIFSRKSQTVELALDPNQAAVQPNLKAGWNLVGMTNGASWPKSAVVIWGWKNGRFVIVDKTKLQTGHA